MNNADNENNASAPIQPDGADSLVIARQLEQEWFALLSSEAPATLDQVQAIWRKRPALLNLRDRKNRNALYYAVMTGKVEVVAWLVAHDRHKPSKPTEAFLVGVMNDLATRVKATCQAIERYLQGQSAAALEELHCHFAAKPSPVPSPDAVLMKYLVAGASSQSTDAPGVSLNGFMEGGVHARNGSDPGRRFETLVFEYLLVSSSMDMEVAKAREDEIYDDRTGMIAKKVFRQAFDYYQQAAESGNAEAQFCAALMHEDVDLENDMQPEYVDEDVDFGIETDAEQATELYAKAAAQGHPEARFRMGAYCLNELNVPGNAERAFGWFYDAAQQDHYPAVAMVGRLYLEGIGTGKDYAKAYSWLIKAAEQGERYAMLDLARMYDQGLGMGRDLERRNFWCEAATKAKDYHRPYDVPYLEDTPEYY